MNRHVRDRLMHALRPVVFFAGIGAGTIAFLSGEWRLLGVSVIAYFLLRGS